jgi:hypothetical protein
MRSQKVKLTSYDKDLQILTPVITELNLTLLPIKKNDSKDIVLVQMANLIPVSSSDQYTVSPLEGVIRASVGNQSNVMVEDTNLKKFNDVLISNEVFILGYPSSLSFNNDPQIEYKRPLLRKGIVAGKNLIKETIILDCPVYFGNSGGIVIQVDEIGNGVRKFNIIGVVSQYIPFVERLKSLQLGYENVSFENSGYSVAVPTDTILELAGS